MIARHLTPEFFGQLSFLLALTALVIPFNSLGLNSLVTNEIVSRPADVEGIIGSALIMRFVSGLVVMAITMLISFYLLPPSEWILLNVLVAASVFNAAIVVDLWLQAYLANRYGAILRLIVICLFSLIRLVAVWLGAEISVFIYILGVEIVFTAILYVCLYLYLSKGLASLNASLEECSRLLYKARWLFFSGLAAIVYIKIDQVMLKLMVDDVSVGHYAIAAKFTEMWYFIPAAVVTSYFPKLILQSSLDQKIFSCNLQKINDVLFSMGVLIAVMITVSAYWVVPLIFGDAYVASVPIIVIHTWSSILVFMRALTSKWLIIQNFPGLSFISQLLGALSNVALNCLWIPHYGAVGAAYATLVSFFIAGYACLFLHSNLWPMALIVSKSFLLPVRMIFYGKSLYRI